MPVYREKVSSPLQWLEEWYVELSALAASALREAEEEMALPLAEAMGKDRTRAVHWPHSGRTREQRKGHGHAPGAKHKTDKALSLWKNNQRSFSASGKSKLCVAVNIQSTMLVNI